MMQVHTERQKFHAVANCSEMLPRLLALAPFVFTVCAISHAGEAPRFVEKGGRWALLVDGQPYLILGGQVHNSSGWPSELPAVWKSLAELHANTVEAPVYWEQMEPQEGEFSWDNVDAVIKGGREHNLHVVLLWFGTWKNGNMHYVPQWVKTDTKRFPRVIRADGEPIDVLSASGRSTLQADKAAFVALMRHLKAFDGTDHTVLMVQVENESGIIGSPRDFSPESNKEFAGQVAADMLAAAHKQPGTWSEVFHGDADELFQLYHQAHYLNEIATAGKAEFDIPIYMNVWLSYPPAELPERRLPIPGIQYPSGGAVQRWVGFWRVLAPSISAIAPDIYGDDTGFVRDVLAAYHRPDNPLLVPEIAKTDSFARYDLLALGEGAIGIAPFGVDPRGWNILGDSAAMGHARNFALLAPMSREVAKLNFEGKLKTSMEEVGRAQQELDFGPWQATVSYGFPQYDGRRPPGTKDAHGVALVAQLGPDEFLVTGIDVSVSFHLPGKLPGMRMQILSAEEGSYENGVWKPVRLWNGDETDRGLQFYAGDPAGVRIRLGKF
ncbi:MAG: glycosyl hydrolase [Acidobacteria bacterium]|nr:MAG: glycosyl hydrolase [Acidobacteriota bacterium]PYV70417.1 MAG: glycosyl hydrolase [Acidobacteriota bacterium]